jgi:hypothetical protein
MQIHHSLHLDLVTLEHFSSKSRRSQKTRFPNNWTTQLNVNHEATLILEEHEVSIILIIRVSQLRTQET